MEKNKQFWRLIVAILCSTQLLFANAFAADKVLDISRLDGPALSLSEYFAVLEDASLKLTVADLQNAAVAARFKTVVAPAAGLGFGSTRSAFWLRLTLRNSSDQPLQRMLELAYSRLTHVRFHQSLAGGGYRQLSTGCLLPFATRPYPNRFFVFPISLPAHAEQTVYLRVEASSPLLVPAKLWTPAAFHAHERNDYMGQAWYFGIATAMIIFNLLLFIALRDVVYLLYVSFVSCMSFTLAAHHGLVKEFLWFDSPLWSLVSATTGYSMTVATLVLFMRHMLKTWVLLPKFDRFLKFMAGVYLLLLPLGFIVSFETFIQPGQMLTIVMMLVIMGTALYGSVKRQRSAFLFTTAFLVLFFAAGLTALTGLGLLPVLFDTSEAVQIGSAVEMLLLAFALADRFNQLRLEKDKAQKGAAGAQQRLLENLMSSERMLEIRVEERTAELRASNGTLESTLRDLRLLQTQLVASERLAWQGQQVANQALDQQRQFMDMLSHEVKTPMSVIRMALGMDHFSATVKRHALQSVQDIDSVIERCLQTDRLDHGQLALQRQPCRLDAMLAELRQASAAPQRLLVSLPELPAIDTDHQLLHIALNNLIDNALKYSSADSVVLIDASPARRLDRPGILINIVNPPGGAGMPDSRRVFDKYYRSPQAHGKTGSGLGLYLVKNIAELLGGFIRYRPSDTEVRFELWLPC